MQELVNQKPEDLKFPSFGHSLLRKQDAPSR